MDFATTLIALWAASIISGICLGSLVFATSAKWGILLLIASVIALTTGAMLTMKLTTLSTVFVIVVKGLGV